MKKLLLAFMFLLIGLGWFLSLEGAETAYNVPAGTTTWGQALSPYRTCIAVCVHDSTASLQTYLDGTRLDSILAVAGQPFTYWGKIDSFNLVRPNSTRATILLGQPEARTCPEF
jgi:hypothetical protein